jgi:hypothetical protein
VGVGGESWRAIRMWDLLVGIWLHIKMKHIKEISGHGKTKWFLLGLTATIAPKILEKILHWYYTLLCINTNKMFKEPGIVSYASYNRSLNQMICTMSK